MLILKSQAKANWSHRTIQISGEDLKAALKVWAQKFRYMRFGVCSGPLFTEYLLVVSNKNPIQESELDDIVNTIEQETNKQWVT